MNSAANGEMSIKETSKKLQVSAEKEQEENWLLVYHNLLLRCEPEETPTFICL